MKVLKKDMSRKRGGGETRKGKERKTGV